jgi:cytochrome c-type biogenesis protein CcmE
MKPKHRRLLTVLIVALVMGGAAAGILSSFRDQLIFFYTPTELYTSMAENRFERGREVRLGGLVKEGSIYRTKSGKTGFIITDLTHEVHASYTGLLPALFREGQGVVAQGQFNDKDTFVARTILAKHDENYMPREVVDALQKSGRWQHAEESKDATP